MVLILIAFEQFAGIVGKIAECLQGDLDDLLLNRLTGNGGADSLFDHVDDRLFQISRRCS